jgi:uracil-DNA glycosylase
VVDAEGANGGAFARLRDEIIGCRACPRLVAWREAAATHPPSAYAGETYWAKPLPGFGEETARLVLVGLAPAAHGGNRTGRMFTGDRSGDFLYAALWRAGFANQSEGRRLLSRATVYLALGAFAYGALARTPPVTEALTGRRPPFAHGTEIPLGQPDRQRWLLCSYHPSQRNVFTGLLTAAMLDDVLERATKLLSSG